MTGDDKTTPGSKEKSVNPQKQPPRQEPEWADGLRSLYGSVVDEPLPENLRDLLSRLDDKE